MPVYNADATLKSAIDSVLNQSFTDFELIISDNCSTDSTSLICQEYVEKDPRVTYLRQSSNIGGARNLKFVLDQGKSKYFLWAAGDDVRSFDFLKENVDFLENHTNYVASTSPNCFEGQEPTSKNLVVFEIVGNVEERFIQFFDNCWKSHGIFYSVFRRHVLGDCDVLNHSFAAVDWVVNLTLIKNGNIHRSANGLTIFGVNGVSSGADRWGAFRNDFLEWIVPFKSMSSHVFRLSVDFPFAVRFRIVKRLIRFNIAASYLPIYSVIHAVLHPIYSRYIKKYFAFDRVN
jgi:glycosyltransferase involved in cell wall biosynthesis